MKKRGAERGNLTEEELRTRIKQSGVVAENEAIRYTRDDAYVYVLGKQQHEEMTGVTVMYWHEFSRRLQQTVERYMAALAKDANSSDS